MSFKSLLAQQSLSQLNELRELLLVLGDAVRISLFIFGAGVCSRLLDHLTDILPYDGNTPNRPSGNSQSLPLHNAVFRPSLDWCCARITRQGARILACQQTRNGEGQEVIAGQGCETDCLRLATTWYPVRVLHPIQRT